jgi:hypothetical protein
MSSITKDNIGNFTTAQILEAYNAKAPTTVKRFADRATAEKRYLALLADAAPSKAAAKPAKTKKAAASKESKPKLSDKERSDAIAESWNDPKIAAKRAERTRVKVEGVEYQSVADAFRKLKLPMSGHIKFRMALKATESGRLSHEGKMFTVVKEKAE